MLFFPMLYHQDEGPHISQGDLAVLYNQCVRPTVEQVMNTRISHWPVDYEAGMMAARDVSKKFHFPTFDIPARHLQVFAEQLRLRLAQHAQFRDSFFVHEWRGLKGRTFHDPDDLEQTDEALTAACGSIDFSQLTRDDLRLWWIDIGLEVMVEGHVVQWLTDGHEELLQYMMPSAPQQRIQTLLRSQRFHKDISTLLYDLSGFRVEVPSLGAEDHVCYLNVYTTDKSPTYQLHKGSFSRHRSTDLFPSRISLLLNDVKHLGKLYDICAGAYGVVQEGAGRLEARTRMLPGVVPAKMRELSRELINQVVICFNPSDWW